MKTRVQNFDNDFVETITRLFAPLGKRACPIYRQLSRREFEVIGTAVPVRGQKYTALLTAAHVLDQITDRQVLIAGSRKFLRFPAITVKFTHSRPAPAIDIDVAAIALPADGAAELSEYYEFTGADELSEFDDYDKLTLYGFVGCPHRKNRQTPHKPGDPIIRPYFYVVREYGELISSTGKRSITHVSFQAPLRNVPDPHGISGCGVWKIKLNKESGEISRPQLVGIGIEYISKQATFVATRIGAGAIAIGELWKRLDEGRLAEATIELRENDNGGTT